MVANAPRFYEIAKEVVELTEGCIFVAHNVNFDYSFLREEFKRLAYDWQREKLCTVRTSRSLIPGLPSYSLGKLCNNLGIEIHARHRAKGDADATVELLERLISINPSLGNLRRTGKDPYAGIPASIDRKGLDSLPEDPGLYYFHGKEGEVLHVAAASDVRRAAIKELVQIGSKKHKSKLLADHLFDVTFEQTGSELLAKLRLLAESEHLKLPITAKKRASGKYAVFAYPDQRGYLRLYVDKLSKGRQGYGKFATDDDAKAALESRMRKYGLCKQLTGFEQGAGACEWHNGDEKGCPGACTGIEDVNAYNERLEYALKGLGFPYPAFFLVGEGRKHQEIGIVAIEHGNLLGFAYLDANESWDDPEMVKGLLKPLPNSEEARQLLRQHLLKAFKQKMIPY
jgi:DNA polymerase-3 subunit epsilon